MEQILNTLVEKYKDEMFEKIAEFVRLETVNDQATATEGAPYGKANREALDKFMELGEKLGFEVIQLLHVDHQVLYSGAPQLRRQGATL